MKKLVEILKELGRIKFYLPKPRSKEDGIWKRVRKKQARNHFDRGLYSLEEYKRKIKEINKV